MVKPEDELPGMAEHILSLRISGWDSQTGICLPVNSLKHTPVPDCVATLSSLWERNKDSLARLDLRAYYENWGMSGSSLLCCNERNVPGRSRVPRMGCMTYRIKLRC